jgi:hypothetical protein
VDDRKSPYFSKNKGCKETCNNPVDDYALAAVLTANTMMLPKKALSIPVTCRQNNWLKRWQTKKLKNNQIACRGRLRSPLYPPIKSHQSLEPVKQLQSLSGAKFIRVHVLD